MRAPFLAFLICTAGLITSCTTAPDQRNRSEDAQRELTAALSGRVAQAPVNCLPNFRTTQQQVIDDSTILYREGSTVYVQKPRNACYGLASGAYTLVTKSYGTGQICDGDISQLVDLRTGMIGGACVFGPFTPYKKATGN